MLFTEPDLAVLFEVPLPVLFEPVVLEPDVVPEAVAVSVPGTLSCGVIIALSGFAAVSLGAGTTVVLSTGIVAVESTCGASSFDVQAPRPKATRQLARSRVRAFMCVVLTVK